MRHGVIALFWASLAACASEGPETNARLSDSAGRRDSIAGVVAASLTEPGVIGLLAHVHAADSALGALGAARGSVLEVKEFGRMVLREHHALRRDLLALANQLALSPQPPALPPDDAPAQMRERLASDSGAAWDRAYMSYAIAVHQASMENMARALAATRQREVKGFIDRSIPIVQKHLDKARSLRRSLPRPEDTGPAGS
jgi:putative membrane protein